MSLFSYFVRCRLAADPHGNSPDEHGFDGTDAWFREAEEAVQAWAVEFHFRGVVLDETCLIPAHIALQIADTLAGCCEIAGELRVANLARASAESAADALGPARSTKLLADLLLEQLTHLSHLVVNLALYTLARHPRVRTLNLDALEATRTAGATA